MLMTTKEAAALLRVHPKQIYRLLKRGLPAHRVGDEWRFEEQEVLRWAQPERSSPASVAADPPSRAALPLLAGNGDLALEVILNELRELRAPLLGHVQADHSTGLELLRRGAVLAAGSHGDAAPLEIAGGKLALIHLATRELGLAFTRGLRVRRASTIVGRRFASRPPTAGIRLRLDEVLRREGVDPVEAHADASIHGSHRDAVMAVVRGDAEIALASRAWAIHAGLGFRPLVSEGYGLVLDPRDLGHPSVIALCEIAQSAAYRLRLAGYGYEPARAGEIRFGTGHAS